MKALKLTMLAAAAILAASPALAQKVSTNGGLKVTSDDGKFEVTLGGRIHFDYYAFDRDIATVTNGSEFRRARLTLGGKAWGWEYKLEHEFTDGPGSSVGSNPGGFRDVYIARKLLGGSVLIGQFKPSRGMEELTSSNETTFLERPFISATGIYTGRQFQQGLGYRAGGDNYSVGASVHNLRAATAALNEGFGVTGRVTFAPVNTKANTLHLGLSVSHENLNRGSVALTAVGDYAGRRGPRLAVASTGVAAPTNPDRSIDSYILELAGAFGPFYFQSEYARADFDRGTGVTSQDVDAFYIQASWMLTGERKPYSASSGVFRSARPAGENGAWELAVRYDSIENKDVVNTEATSTTIGLNYYHNPQVRFVLNYIIGDNDLNGDKTKQIGLRTQIAF